jgi:AbrB family looped-hinge helix DNA binding protein
MAKVTSKLQVTIPKAIAKRHGIEPGDEVTWTDAGDAIRLEPVEKGAIGRVAIEDRVKWFDDATERVRCRRSTVPMTAASTETERGWTREELYSRGGAG